MVVIATVWSGIVFDQIPRFMGVPKLRLGITTFSNSALPLFYPPLLMSQGFDRVETRCFPSRPQSESNTEPD